MSTKWAVKVRMSGSISQFSRAVLLRPARFAQRGVWGGKRSPWISSDAKVRSCYGRSAYLPGLVGIEIWLHFRIHFLQRLHIGGVHDNTAAISHNSLDDGGLVATVNALDQGLLDSHGFSVDEIKWSDSCRVSRLSGLLSIAMMASLQGRWSRRASPHLIIPPSPACP